MSFEAESFQRFVFVLMAPDVRFDQIYDLAIRPACDAAGASSGRVEEQMFLKGDVEGIHTLISASDLVIVEASPNSAVFYAVGMAVAAGKKLLLLTPKLAYIPYQLSNYPHVLYGGDIVALRRELIVRIAENLKPHENAHMFASHSQVRSAAATVAQPAAAESRIVRRRVFIAYSHRDAKWLKRLHVHLRPLERDSDITRWDDTLLVPGDEWRRKIRDAIDAARVAILLISADFLASEFVQTNELPPLLAAAESANTTILLVIIGPSRFEQIEALARFQTVNNPSKPIINMTRSQQEQVFADIATRVANLLPKNAG
jgi:hypothetical protein